MVHPGLRRSVRPWGATRRRPSPARRMRGRLLAVATVAVALAGLQVMPASAQLPSRRVQATSASSSARSAARDGSSLSRPSASTFWCAAETKTSGLHSPTA